MGLFSLRNTKHAFCYMGACLQTQTERTACGKPGPGTSHQLHHTYYLNKLGQLHMSMVLGTSRMSFANTAFKLRPQTNRPNSRDAQTSGAEFNA